MAARKPLVLGSNVVEEWQAGDAVALGHPCGTGAAPTLTTSGLSAGTTVAITGTDFGGEITVTTALVSLAVSATINVTFATPFTGRAYVNLSASTTNAIQTAAATNQTATGFTLSLGVVLAVSSTYRWAYTTVGPVGG